MGQNAYIVYAIILLALFIAVLFWAFGKKRKKPFEKDAEIPFQDR